MRSKSKQHVHKVSGFTLVELLVVVSIIAILAVAGMVSYSSANARARDARRKADLAKVQTALEMYRSDNSGYPDINSFDTLLGLTYLGDGYLSDANISDPDPNRRYFYEGQGTCGASGCSGYILCAELSNAGAGDSCDASGQHNYSVTNP